MANSSKFDGLACRYAQFRPDYPAAIFERIRDLLAPETLASGPLLIDIGCGTGISTRRLRAAFGSAADLRIVGLEPSDDMRVQAIAAAAAADRIEYLPGAAESLPFPDRSSALVMAAQAAHWFDRPRFYGEAARVLVPGGGIAIVFNNRRWQDDRFQDEYETLLERISPGFQRAYRHIDFVGELNATGNFAPTSETHVDWRLPQTRQEFLGMSLSTTYIRAAINASSQAAIEAEINALWDKHLKNDEILSVPYRTELFAARLC
jgi:ubiquinone/menaquinone biosynthesis C-methylase UbiE